MSSPSKSVKAAATNLLAILERLLVKLIEEAKFGPGISVAYPLISRPESIVFRFLQQLWFQVSSRVLLKFLKHYLLLSWLFF